MDVCPNPWIAVFTRPEAVFRAFFARDAGWVAYLASIIVALTVICTLMSGLAGLAQAALVLGVLVVANFVGLWIAGDRDAQRHGVIVTFVGMIPAVIAYSTVMICLVSGLTHSFVHYIITFAPWLGCLSLVIWLVGLHVALDKHYLPFFAAVVVALIVSVTGLHMLDTLLYV